MSDEPLPGYKVDDDPTLEPDSPDDVVLVASSAGTGDTVRSEATTASRSPQPQSQQQQAEERTDAAATAATDTTTITSTAPTPSLSERTAVDEFADPKIASLHAIFPDYDAALLYTVVDSVGGDQDRAVDALLAMSDPNHVPTHQTTAREPSVAEQTLLDEEFARQLLLEDEQQYARDQIARRQQQQQQQQPNRQFPYAQRTNAPMPPQQPNGGTYGDGAAQQSPQRDRDRDTMAEVQEQFTKLAESGKRTFSSLVSKVKAKVQEFEHTRNTPNNSISGTSTDGGYAAQPPSPVLDRHAQQAYYAPRPVQSTPPQVQNIPPSGDNRAVKASVPPSSSDEDPVGVPPPPATNSGRPVSNNIDPDKIGLLPKRPVSLMNTESRPNRAHDDDEEELEYVENPFEEGQFK